MMSVEAHGAISGIEFRQTRYGSVVGRKSTATYQSTPLQQKTRGRLIAAHRAWETLTDAARAAWNAHATHPATGRNTFIAMWLRFTLTGVTPLLRPGISDPPIPKPDFILQLDLLYPNVVSVTWTPALSGSNAILFYVLHTFSGRTLPTLSQMRYKGISSSVNDYFGYTLPIAAPYIHVRCDEISFLNGDLLGRHIVSGKNPWI